MKRMHPSPSAACNSLHSLGTRERNSMFTMIKCMERGGLKGKEGKTAGTRNETRETGKCRHMGKTDRERGDRENRTRREKDMKRNQSIFSSHSLSLPHITDCVVCLCV